MCLGTSHKGDVGRVFQVGRPRHAWYAEGQVISPQHDPSMTRLGRVLAGLALLGRALEVGFVS